MDNTPQGDKKIKRKHVLVTDAMYKFIKVQPQGMGVLIRSLIKARMEHFSEEKDTIELRKQLDAIEPEYFSLKARINDLEKIGAEEAARKEKEKKSREKVYDSLKLDMIRTRELPTGMNLRFFSEVSGIPTKELREWSENELKKMKEKL